MPSSESNVVVPSLEQAKTRAFILRHVAVYALANPPPAVSAAVFARCDSRVTAANSGAERPVPWNEPYERQRARVAH